MNKNEHSTQSPNEKISLNLAIVGGGRTCRFFIELLDKESFSYLSINLVGVCDINEDAQGMIMARKMGIYTTNDFHDLFRLENLDGILELTNSRDVLLELIRLRPRRVGVLEHNIGRLLRSLFTIDQRLKSAERQILFEKMISGFLIQEAKQRILIINPDFTIADANQVWLAAINKSRQEVIGSFCYRTIHGLNTPCSEGNTGFSCPMVETLRTCESSHVIREDPSSGEHEAYIDIVTYPVKDQDNEIVHIIEIWRDITRELSSRWENRVRRLKKDMHKLIEEDRMISLGKLAASCVHEINNPIQGLLTFNRLMTIIVSEDDPGAQEIERFRYYLDIMGKELERCGKIVSGLLSFSRQAPMEYRDIDINQVLYSVIALTGHKLELSNITFNNDFFPGLLIVRGDTNRLQQCFLNLIFNAIEAMPHGGNLWIESKQDKNDKKIIIEVRDSGDGISSENMNHIFDPFFTTKDQNEGTGLGLSIVYGVIKDHGGKIEVESLNRQGTSFTISFPFVG